MSYEGREVLLCEIGHSTVHSALSLQYHGDLIFGKGCEAKIRKEECGKKFVDIFSIDDTNGEGVDPDLAVVAVAEICACGTCGNLHEVVPPRYAPAGDGWRKI